MARAKLTFAPPTTIPLDRLEHSENNVRRVKPGMPVQTLADSIARRGLLQSLSVRPILDDAGAETGRYRVHAGGRRLEALQLLVKQKRLARNAPIPCLVKTDGIEEEDSLSQTRIARLCTRSISSGPLPHSRRRASRSRTSPLLSASRLRSSDSA